MTSLQPCSLCKDGNHDACQANGSPFCGCHQEGHPGHHPGPIVAPIGEVMEAGARAPRSEVAQAQEALAAQEGATAPVVQGTAPVSAMALLGGPPPTPDADAVKAATDAVMAKLAGTLPELDDLAPDEDPEAELAPDQIPDRGQAGLQAAAPVPAASAPPSPEIAVSAEPPASPAVPTAGEPLTVDSIPMVAERDPALLVSVWDSHQAHFAGEVEPSTPTTPEPAPSAPAPTSVDSSAEPEGITVAEHHYLGTPDEPYACACGANPGSLNKLGAHLGITGDVDAMAQLAAATTPTVMEAIARGETPGSVIVPPAIPVPTEPEWLPSMTSTTQSAATIPARVQEVSDLVVHHTGANATLTATGSDVSLTFDLEGRSAGPYPVEELPEAMPIITYLLGYDPTVEPPVDQALAEQLSETMAPGESITIEGDLVGAVANAMGWRSPTNVELLADHIRGAISDHPDTAHMLAPDTPYRLVLVDGDTGDVWEALYSDAAVPTEAADVLLEALGFDPSPLDDDHPAVPMPARPAPSDGTASMSALPGQAATRPTRTQVARHTSTCARCNDPVEPGTLLGFFPGVGWGHLTHS